MRRVLRFGRSISSMGLLLLYKQFLPYHTGMCNVCCRPVSDKCTDFHHRSVTYVAGLACATTQYNLIDSPVGTVPVTRVNPDLDGLTSEYDATNSKGQGSSGND